MSLLQRATECIAKQSTHQALNAFISRVPQDATLQAVRAAEQSHSLSPLNGKLIAVKDNICTLDLPTTCASNILHGYKSPYAATVVEQLANAGAVVAGKTNLDEFGMGSHSANSAYEPVFGPNGQLSAGGSSGGSAVAVATGQSWAALGTDTGGSVRLPASYCGVVGFKPSYGRLSRHGVVAYANSLDTVGILASTSQDAKTMYETLDHFDSKDPTSLSVNLRSRIAEAIQSRKARSKLRIGVPLEFNVTELQDTIGHAWCKTLQKLADRGHEIYNVSLPSVQQALSAYYVLAPAEASSNLAKYDGARYGNPATTPRDFDTVLFSRTRREGLGAEVRRRILLGAYSLSASAIDNYFIQAQRVRRLLQRDFDRAFALGNPLLDQTKSLDDQGVDVLLSPTAPTLPPPLASVTTLSPLESYRDDVLTVPASLAGLPAISVPVQLQDAQDANVPTTGMQITGQFGDEDMVFQAARLLEDLN